MNRIGIDQIAQAVGGRVIGPDGAARQAVSRVCTDSRQIEPNDLFVALKGPNFDGHDFVASALAGGAAAAMVSQPIKAPPTAKGRDGGSQPPALPDGRPAALILVRDPLAALGRLAGWYRRRLPATVIAVTGSNGKTTTKAMIEHLLGKDPAKKLVAAPRSFNNAVGLPLTLLSADAGHDVVVCEIGSSAPGEIAALGQIAMPDIAVIVNASETHLEKLRSLDGVAVEKASLLGTLAPGGFGIINADRPALLAAAKTYHKNLIRFGHDPQADLVLGQLVSTAEGIRFTVNGADRVELSLLGRHNAVNALAAIAVARRMGLSVAEAGARLADFQLPPMRLERIKAGSIQVINDAYNANPASMAAALDVLSDLPCRPGRKVFICGDMLELGPHSPLFHVQLGQRIAAAGVAQLIAVGRFAAQVVQGACEAGLAAEQTCQFPTTDALADRVAELVGSGDLVLVKGSRGMALERVIQRLAGPPVPTQRARGSRPSGRRK